jgi:hypothetical protein
MAGSRGVKKLIVASGVHRFRRLGPSRPWRTSGPDDQPTVFGLELDFVGQSRVFEQAFGNTDAFRVSDLNDSGPDDHVTTL